MDKMQDRRVLLSASAKTKLDEYISAQKAKNPGVPGYMPSRNAVVSDIVVRFIEESGLKEKIQIVTNAN